jgi:hypothetical protein
MAFVREDEQALSVLIDIQDGLFELRQDLLIVIAARAGVSSWSPTNNEKIEDEVGTLTCLLDAYLDSDPRAKIKELIDMTEMVVKGRYS